MRIVIVAGSPYDIELKEIVVVRRILSYQNIDRFSIAKKYVQNCRQVYNVPEIHNDRWWRD